MCSNHTHFLINHMTVFCIPCIYVRADEIKYFYMETQVPQHCKWKEDKTRTRQNKWKIKNWSRKQLKSRMVQTFTSLGGDPIDRKNSPSFGINLITEIGQHALNSLFGTETCTRDKLCLQKSYSWRLFSYGCTGYNFQLRTRLDFIECFVSITIEVVIFFRSQIINTFDILHTFLAPVPKLIYWRSQMFGWCEILGLILYLVTSMVFKYCRIEILVPHKNNHLIYGTCICIYLYNNIF